LAFSFFFFLIHEWVDEQRSTAERENKKFTQKENLLLAPHQIELAQPRVLLFRSLSWKSPRGEGMFTHSIGDIMTGDAITIVARGRDGIVLCSCILSRLWNVYSSCQSIQFLLFGC
jgi:hypothetical protein